MSPGALRLSLSSTVRASLARILEEADRAQAESDISARFTSDPWGDLEEFGVAVYDPLNGISTRVRAVHPDFVITVPGTYVRPLRDVIQAFSESWAGAVPWIVMTPAEREATRWTIDALADPAD